MLRLAACLLVERGIGLCAPVHDAVMVEGPANKIEEVVAQTRATMAEASRIVLAGFEIGTDAKIVRWPDRYVDEAGADFWETVMRLAGPVPEFGNPTDLVRESCGTTSGILPNRATLLEESSRESLLSLGTGDTYGRS
jgi:hypothetical protein